MSWLNQKEACDSTSDSYNKYKSQGWSRLLQCFFLNLSSGLGLWRVNYNNQPHIDDWSDLVHYLQLKNRHPFQNFQKEFSLSFSPTVVFSRSCTTWTASWKRTGTPCRPTSSWSWELRRTNSCSSCFPARWPKQVRWDAAARVLNEHHSPARHNRNGNFLEEANYREQCRGFFFCLHYRANCASVSRFPRERSGKWVS